MFKTGKFFNHPVDNIGPNQKQTIFVMNTDGLHLAGVSGGVRSLLFIDNSRNNGILLVI